MAKYKKEKSKTPAIKKIKLLISVVNKSKALFYIDLLEQFEINVQLVANGKGTANHEMLQYLGLANTDKAVIFSFVREEKVKEVLTTLQEKFEKVKNGKGIAFTIPLSSIIGVFSYQLLGNITR
ncbi:MAG: hypothetical protein MR270_06555 [Erysipelotrichaceae bacterium]|nr:hypothetical protein [Erysipelotrichaceae bacterium]